MHLFVMKSLRPIAILFATVLACVGFAADVSSFLSARKQHGVAGITEAAALSTSVTEKVIEVRGTITGSATSGNGAGMLLVAVRGGGETIAVDCPDMQDWYVNNTAVRMLLRVDRVLEGSLPSFRLVMAIEEHKIGQHEAVELEKAEARKPAPVTEEANRASALPSPGQAQPNQPRQWVLPASDAVPHYTAYIKKRNPRLSENEAWRIAQSVVGFSIQFGVDARLVMAVVSVESGFNPDATSPKGAMGLGQLMPGTARGIGVRNAYDSVDNLYGTVKLLRQHLDNYIEQTGDPGRGLVLTLAAYNAGSGAVRRHGGVPPYAETQRYIEKVLSAYRKFSGV